MKNEWSQCWNSSVQPRKQRKFRFNAPLHVARTFLAAPLSKELRKKHSAKSIIVRKGDKVKVLRGQYAGKIGNVEDVHIRYQRIAVEGVNYTGRDGKKKPYLISPSKVVILELNLDDKKRKASLDKSKSQVKTVKKVEVKTEKKVEVKTETKTEKSKSTKGVKQ